MALHLPTKFLKHALHWTGGGMGNQRCDVLATTSLTSLVAMAQEKEEGNHIILSTYFQVLDTPAHGHNLWHGQ